MRRKNSSKFLVNLILLIVVLITLVSVGLFFNAYKLSSVSKLEPINNWKTYKNTKYGFSFKYPSEIKEIIPNQYAPPGLLLELYLKGPTQTETEINDGFSLTFTSGEIGKQTLEELVSQKAEVPSKMCKGYKGYVDKISKITISGIQGYEYKECYPVFSTDILITLQNNQYLQIIDETKDPTNQGYQKIVDQILSTFKFLQ